MAAFNELFERFQDGLAGDPGAPKAAHDVQILGSDTHFTNRLVGTDLINLDDLKAKDKADVDMEDLLPVK